MSLTRVTRPPVNTSELTLLAFDNYDALRARGVSPASARERVEAGLVAMFPEIDREVVRFAVDGAATTRQRQDTARELRREADEALGIVCD